MHTHNNYICSRCNGEGFTFTSTGAVDQARCCSACAGTGKDIGAGSRTDSMNLREVLRSPTPARSNVQVQVTHGIIGPRHDPYSRSIYTAQVGAKHLRLTCCALTGTALEVNGAVQSKTNYGMGVGREPNDQQPIEEFERLVGRSLDDIIAEDEQRSSEDPMGPIGRYI